MAQVEITFWSYWRCLLCGDEIHSTSWERAAGMPAYQSLLSNVMNHLRDNHFESSAVSFDKRGELVQGINAWVF